MHVRSSSCCWLRRRCRVRLTSAAPSLTLAHAWRRQHTTTSPQPASSSSSSATATATTATTTTATATTAAAALTSDELDKLARLVENDPRILMEVVARLEPQSRRRLVVAGGAMEWFGKESAAQEVERADVDKDRRISPKDFDHWFESALKQRSESARRRGSGSATLLANGGSTGSTGSNKDVTSLPSSAAEVSATSSPSSSSSSVAVVTPSTSTTMAVTTPTTTTLATTPAATASSAAMTTTTMTANTAMTMTSTSAASQDARVPLSGLLLVAVQAGLPFVGFGFLDNATMIVAGDLIDSTLGFYLNCSILASAAMGNICSGMFGMQVHGLIDKATRRLFRQLPALTAAQLTNRRVFFAGHLGGTVGIAVGLLLGMCPLLFLREDANEKSDYAMFCRWDSGKSGYIELPELEHVLAALGVCQTHDTANRVMAKYGTDSRMSFEQYSHFKDDLRQGHPVFD